MANKLMNHSYVASLAAATAYASKWIAVAQIIQKANSRVVWRLKKKKFVALYLGSLGKISALERSIAVRLRRKNVRMEQKEAFLLDTKRYSGDLCLGAI